MEDFLKVYTNTRTIIEGKLPQKNNKACIRSYRQQKLQQLVLCLRSL